MSKYRIIMILEILIVIFIVFSNTVINNMFQYMTLILVLLISIVYTSEKLHHINNLNKNLYNFTRLEEVSVLSKHNNLSYEDAKSFYNSNNFKIIRNGTDFNFIVNNIDNIHIKAFICRGVSEPIYIADYYDSENFIFELLGSNKDLYLEDNIIEIDGNLWIDITQIIKDFIYNGFRNNCFSILETDSINSRFVFYKK